MSRLNYGSKGSSDVLKLANGPQLIFLVRDQLPMRWKKGVLLARTPYKGMQLGGGRGPAKQDIGYGEIVASLINERHHT